jgi:hypothetical protein
MNGLWAKKYRKSRPSIQSGIATIKAQARIHFYELTVGG